MSASTGQNAFLAGLRTEDLTLVRPHLSRTELRAGDNLGFRGDPIEEGTLSPLQPLMSRS
jgi:hypothetical protein